MRATLIAGDYFGGLQQHLFWRRDDSWSAFCWKVVTFPKTTVGTHLLSIFVHLHLV